MGSRPAGILVFNFVDVCTHCAFLERVSLFNSNVPLCFFFAEDRKEVSASFFERFEAVVSQCVVSGLACLVRGAVKKVWHPLLFGIFQPTDVRALLMPSCEIGATSPSFLNTVKTKTKMGAEKIGRHWLVRRRNVSRL